MRATVNMFNELNGSTLLSTLDHVLVTRAMGWGEPQTYSAFCSCGWRSLDVEEEFEGYGPLLSSLHPFVDKYGKNAINLGRAVYGNKSTVVRMCLEHLDLPLSKMLNDHLAELDYLQKRLSKGAVTSADANDLRVLAERLMVITTALEIMATVPLAQLEPVSDEIVAEYNEILKKTPVLWLKVAD